MGTYRPTPYRASSALMRTRRKRAYGDPRPWRTRCHGIGATRCQSGVVAWWFFIGALDPLIGGPLGGGSPCGVCRLLAPAGRPECSGFKGNLDLADEEIGERSERRRPAGENPWKLEGADWHPGHQPAHSLVWSLALQADAIGGSSSAAGKRASCTWLTRWLQAADGW